MYKNILKAQAIWSMLFYLTKCFVALGELFKLVSVDCQKNYKSTDWSIGMSLYLNFMVPTMSELILWMNIIRGLVSCINASEI